MLEGETVNQKLTEMIWYYTIEELTWTQKLSVAHKVVSTSNASCSFSIAAPGVWNKLSVNTKHAASLASFKSHVKTELYSQFHWELITFLYTVWVKKIPPVVFWSFFPNGWEFLINFLHTYYTIISTLEYKFLFKYLQLWQSFAILSAIT